VSDQDVRDTVYSNAVEVAFSPADFMLDFRLLSPERATFGEAPRQVRVVMHPHHAARLAVVLLKQIQAYQREHGDVPGMKLDIRLTEQGELLPSEGGAPDGK